MANGNGNHSAAGSRRNSISKLPWPEPSPVRELPPPIPKQKVNKYNWKYIMKMTMSRNFFGVFLI